MEVVCAQSIIEQLRGEVCEIGIRSGEGRCPLLEKLARLLAESGDFNEKTFLSSGLACGDLTCPCRIARIE